MAFWNALKEKLKGVTEKWSNGIASLFTGGTVDDSFWEELEEKLLAGDVGIEASEALMERLRAFAKEKRVRERSELKQAFVDLLVAQLEEIDLMGAPIRFDSRPAVVLLVGVNGSGKTTTAGKLASLYRSQGKSVVLAAADTYRAAAVEQLRIWGERSNVRVVAQEAGSDSAAVVFDAIRAAKATNADLVIADTAGRLHTRHNLMEELRKVERIVAREVPEGRREALLVLDAVMGQNAFRQAEVFSEVLTLTGVILTKYDNTAKGGVLLSVARNLRLPIRYVGLGEGVDDLRLFEPRSFLTALVEGEKHNGT